MCKNRYEINIKGIVQGVGFRPFIYKLAQELNLKGWVKNSAEGVTIQVECSSEICNNFILKINQQAPLQSKIISLEIKQLDYVGYQEFSIKKSTVNNWEKTAIVSPDFSTCNDCLVELFEPQNRRYRYPFINCTNCGPRYSIIQELPYDRIATTMKKFTMCAECEAEYNNPLNRRFHAQPNACAKCGPHLELWDKNGKVLAKFDQALLETVKLIKQGNILAIKGLGGFHLVVNATDKLAVKKLRELKNRPDKPFALMYPNLNQIKRDCYVFELEEKILLSSASPIVLLTRIKPYNLSFICEEVSPKNPYLGVMLPYTPLHHLLLRELNLPIIATSGNLHNEPICIDEIEALNKLNHIVDYFLVHNRPIFCPVDDSIVRVINNEIMILRRARGYAPLPINLPDDDQPNQTKILALGGQLKNTIALSFKQQIFLSQHLGNLENSQTINTYQEIIKNLANIYEFKPDLIVCDAHPDYYSTQYAEELSMSKNPNIPIIKVQHHLAHIFSAIAENKVKLPLLGIAWDGTGYGLDKTIWGGEFFYISNEKITRIASFLPFSLIGGNQAILEPQRIALALLYQVFNSFDNFPQEIPLNKFYSHQQLKIFAQMITKQINCPLTSSVGRLFDGISALLGIFDKITFEGQGAMQLEFIIDELITSETYDFNWQYQPNSCSYINWKAMIKNIIDDYLLGENLSIISGKFHQTLVKIILQIAQTVEVKNVVLTGGCFQNKYLLENTINSLKKANFIPFYNKKIPINDGGLALGQIYFAIKSNSITTKIIG